MWERGFNLDYLIGCATLLKEISRYDIFVYDSHGEFMAYFSKGLWVEYFNYIKDFSIKKAAVSCSVETLCIYVDYVIERRG